MNSPRFLSMMMGLLAVGGVKRLRQESFTLNPSPDTLEMRHALALAMNSASPLKLRNQRQRRRDGRRTNGRVFNRR